MPSFHSFAADMEVLDVLTVVLDVLNVVINCQKVVFRLKKDRKIE